MKTNIFNKLSFSFSFSKIYFLIISFVSIGNNYIIFPFIIKNLSIENNNIMTASSYLKYIQNNILSTNIYVGTPQKKLELYLTMDQYFFTLAKGFCLPNSISNYEPIESNSYEKTTTTVFSSLFTNGTLSRENFTFYNNSNFLENILVNKLEFICGIASSDIFDITNPDNICGYLGLQPSSGSLYIESYSLIYDLKSKGIIDSKKWGIKFYDEKNKKNGFDGALFLGIKEKNYNEILDINIDDENYNNYINYNYSSVYSLPYLTKNINWEIKFDEISYKINEQNYIFNKNLQGQLLVDYNYIISNEYFFNNIKNNFFNKYINDNICFVNKNQTLKKSKDADKQLINMIICDKNKFKDMNKFPKIYFTHRELNEIFEFNYWELFQEIGNSIVFSIFFDEENKNRWCFGRIFMKKYLFIFDIDQKTITYLPQFENHKKENNLENDKNDNFKIIILEILLVVFLLLGIALGLYFGKLKWDKSRKKRANELNDEYNYIENEKENNGSKNEALFSDK